MMAIANAILRRRALDSARPDRTVARPILSPRLIAPDIRTLTDRGFQSREWLG